MSLRGGEFPPKQSHSKTSQNSLKLGDCAATVPLATTFGICGLLKFYFFFFSA
jgi:hypothetical protein